jgi:hypothetical protein
MIRVDILNGGIMGLETLVLVEISVYPTLEKRFQEEHFVALHTVVEEGSKNLEKMEGIKIRIQVLKNVKSKAC